LIHNCRLDYKGEKQTQFQKGPSVQLEMTISVDITLLSIRSFASRAIAPHCSRLVPDICVKSTSLRVQMVTI
jgi:hypothetical protein